MSGIEGNKSCNSDWKSKTSFAEVVEGTEWGLGVVKPEGCKTGEIKGTELGGGGQSGVEFDVETEPDVEAELDSQAELDVLEVEPNEEKGRKEYLCQQPMQHLLN